MTVAAIGRFFRLGIRAGRTRAGRDAGGPGSGGFGFFFVEPDVGFGAGNATSDRNRLEADLLNGRVQGHVAAEFIQASAEVESGLEEIFGAHAVELVLCQGVLDASEVGREMLKFLLEGGEVLFLEFFDLDAFDHVNLGALVTFPAEEGGFWDLQFAGDFVEAPAVGAEDQEGGFSSFVCIIFYPF